MFGPPKQLLEQRSEWIDEVLTWRDVPPTRNHLGELKASIAESLLLANQVDMRHLLHVLGEAQHDILSSLLEAMS